MGQAAGKLADGFHFLAMQQRLLQPLSLNAVNLHLGGFLPQQAGGVLKGSGIAGENVKGARQFAKLITPLQGRHRHVLLAVRQPRHCAGYRVQIEAKITIDIPASAPGDRQRQQRGQQDKRADGAQLLVALRRPRLRGLSDSGNILINIAIKQRNQRFDMKHIPTDRQIALFKLRR